MDYVQINGKKYEVIGHDDKGVPTIRGKAISTQDGFDEEGNPKINVKINVPAANLFATPGEQE